MTQTAVEQGKWVEYHPIATLSDSAPIEFEVSGNGSEYVDLANSILKITAAIRRGDGSNLEADDDDIVGPVTNWLHSLFSQVDVSLNNVLLSPSTRNYAYRAFIETLLSYGPSAKNSFLTAEMWKEDTPGHVDKAVVTDNLGFAWRAGRTARSKKVQMMGRLHSDLFFQDRYLLNNVDLRIRLVRNKDEFCILTSSNDKSYRVEITDAVFFARKVSVLPAIRMAHAKALEKGTAKYPIRRVATKVFSVAQGAHIINQENLYLGRLPRRLVVGFVDNRAYNGHKKYNPYHFKHYGLDFLALYVDGNQIPAKPLQPDFREGGEGDGYVRSYLSLFEGTGRLHQDVGNGIAIEDYPKGYTLFAFDLTPDLSDQCHFQPVKDGNLRLEAHFREGLPHTINVICYAEFDNVVEIDRSRNVIFDYTT